MDLRQKQMFHKAVFDRELAYDGKNIGTPEMPIVFSMFKAPAAMESKMASQRGLEPVSARLCPARNAAIDMLQD
jgi:hypothetical protein